MSPPEAFEYIPKKLTKPGQAEALEIEYRIALNGIIGRTNAIRSSLRKCIEEHQFLSTGEVDIGPIKKFSEDGACT